MKYNTTNNNSSGKGVIFIILCVMYIIGVCTPDDKKTCIRYGCDSEAADGSSYCYLHKPYTTSTSYRGTCIKSGCNNTKAYGSSYCYTHKSSSTTTSTSSSTKNYNSSYSSNSNSSKKYNSNSYTSKADSTSHSTHKTLNCDPEDYDSPEDYADDAWGDDFDDYDDAYDYWENY